VDREAPQVQVKPATAAEILPFVVLAGGDAPRDLCERIAAAGYAIIVTEDGVPTFGMVMEPSGRELVVTAAGGRSRNFDLTRAGFAIAEVQGAGFDAIRFQTRRLGLVRKAVRLGYVVIDRQNKNGNVYIMRKAMQ
jgi:hypothetical protein